MDLFLDAGEREKSNVCFQNHNILMKALLSFSDVIDSQYAPVILQTKTKCKKDYANLPRLYFVVSFISKLLNIFCLYIHYTLISTI